MNKTEIQSKIDQLQEEISRLKEQDQELNKELVIPFLIEHARFEFKSFSRLDIVYLPKEKMIELFNQLGWSGFHEYIELLSNSEENVSLSYSDGEFYLELSKSGSSAQWVQKDNFVDLVKRLGIPIEKISFDSFIKDKQEEIDRLNGDLSLVENCKFKLVG